jgi:ArsR family transcriptional regulator
MVDRNKVLYEMQAEICYSLSHPVRLEILDILANTEMTSTELLSILEIPKANLSQHLTVLKDAGILKTRKVGQFQYVSLAIPKIKEACSLVRSILAERIDGEEKRMNELKKNLTQQTKVQSSKSKKKVTKKP